MESGDLLMQKQQKGKVELQSSDLEFVRMDGKNEVY